MRLTLSMEDVVTTKRGTYELVRKLGQGGMGEVWEAYDCSYGGLVAIKFMKDDEPSLRCRFRREAEWLRSLSHPNIVTLIDDGEIEDGKLFLVLERLFGETLEARLARHGALPVRTALEILVVLVSALGAAHDLGIVHRDLKPANVFLHDEQHTNGQSIDVKLLDLGIAKDTRAGNHTNVTEPGARIGSIRYMSPEQLRGDAVDHRADLWAVGLLLYEMIQGEPLFIGSRNLLVNEIQQASIWPVPWRRRKVPEQVSELVARCLQRDLTKRIRSAREVERELVRLLESGEVLDSPAEVDLDAETTADIIQPGQRSVVSTDAALVQTLRNELAEHTRRTLENHRELRRRLAVLGVVGVILMAMSVAILAKSWPLDELPIPARSDHRGQAIDHDPQPTERF